MDRGHTAPPLSVKVRYKQRNVDIDIDKEPVTNQVEEIEPVTNQDEEIEPVTNQDEGNIGVSDVK